MPNIDKAEPKREKVRTAKEEATSPTPSTAIEDPNRATERKDKADPN
jgi:hypothetical protein